VRDSGKIEGTNMRDSGWMELMEGTNASKKED
jgi:hypothetical protein